MKRIKTFLFGLTFFSLGGISFFGYLNRWNDSMATALEAPAMHFADELLGEKGWEVGKHKS